MNKKNGQETKNISPAERALWDSEERFRIVFERSNIDKSLTAPDGRFIKINKAFADMLHYTIEELQKLNFLEITHPDDMAISRESIRSLLEKEQNSYRFEKRYVSKDGGIVWADLNMTLLRDEKGVPLYFITSVIDITERKKEVIRLQESEDKFKAIFENNSAAIAIMEPDTTISMVNDAYCQMSGYSREDVIGLSWTTQIPPEDLDRLKEYNRQRLTDPKSAPDKYEFSFYKKNGEIRSALMSVSLIESSRKIITSFTDITERKRAEEAVKRQADLLELVHDSIIVMDLNSKITYWSRGAYERYGWTSEEALGKVSSELLQTVFPIPFNDVKQEFFQNGYWEGELTQTTKDGSTLFVSSRWQLQKNSDNQPQSILETNNDITARKRSENALRESERNLRQLNATKDKFFSIIAHDLKSPFSAILGFSQLLTDEYRDLDSRSIGHYAGLINSSVQQTYNLLENLLEWAKSQQGNIPFKPVPVLLEKLVSTTIAGLQDIAGQKNLKIINFIPNSLVLVADENMLSFILRNLITNAIKFNNKNGRCLVTADVADSIVLITISDNGIGMSDESISKLFRVETSFSTRGTANEKGSGLGLILCKEFVEKHGGKISAESEMGKGSTFRFTIPQ